MKVRRGSQSDLLPAGEVVSEAFALVDIICGFSVSFMHILKIFFHNHYRYLIYFVMLFIVCVCCPSTVLPTLLHARKIQTVCQHQTSKPALTSQPAPSPDFTTCPQPDPRNLNQTASLSTVRAWRFVFRECQIQLNLIVVF